MAVNMAKEGKNAELDTHVEGKKEETSTEKLVISAKRKYGEAETYAAARRKRHKKFLKELDDEHKARKTRLETEMKMRDVVGTRYIQAIDSLLRGEDVLFDTKNVLAMIMLHLGCFDRETQGDIFQEYAHTTEPMPDHSAKMICCAMSHVFRDHVIDEVDLICIGGILRSRRWEWTVKEVELSMSGRSNGPDKRDALIKIDQGEGMKWPTTARVKSDRALLLGGKKAKPHEDGYVYLKATDFLDKAEYSAITKRLQVDYDSMQMNTKDIYVTAIGKCKILLLRMI